MWRSFFGLESPLELLLVFSTKNVKLTPSKIANISESCPPKLNHRYSVVQAAKTGSPFSKIEQKKSPRIISGALYLNGSNSNYW